jgi:hypothetical protein
MSLNAHQPDPAVRLFPPDATGTPLPKCRVRAHGLHSFQRSRKSCVGRAPDMPHFFIASDSLREFDVLPTEQQDLRWILSSMQTSSSGLRSDSENPEYFHSSLGTLLYTPSCLLMQARFKIAVNSDPRATFVPHSPRSLLDLFALDLTKTALQT